MNFVSLAVRCKVWASGAKAWNYFILSQGGIEGIGPNSPPGKYEAVRPWAAGWAACTPQNPPFANSAPGTLRWTHRPPSPTPNPQQTGSTRGSTAMRTPLARARRGGRAKVTNQRPVPNCHQPPDVAVLTGPRPSRRVGARGSRSLSVHNTCTWKLGY